MKIADTSFNVDVENAMHSNLVTRINFINYKVVPNINFDFIDLESSEFLQTDITPKRKCSIFKVFGVKNVQKKKKKKSKRALRVGTARDKCLE